MRYFNRLLSFLAGVALVGVGVVGAIEAVSTGLDDGFVWIPGHEWIHTLRTTNWSATPVVITFAAITAAGVVLLVAELWRRSRPTLELSITGLPADQLWVAQRRALQARLAHEVVADTPCHTMHATLAYRNGAWRLDLKGTGPPDARAEVERTARAALARIGAPEPSEVRIRLRPIPQKRSKSRLDERTAGSRPDPAPTP